MLNVYSLSQDELIDEMQKRLSVEEQDRLSSILVALSLSNVAIHTFVEYFFETLELCYNFFNDKGRFSLKLEFSRCLVVLKVVFIVEEKGNGKTFKEPKIHSSEDSNILNVFSEAEKYI